jgi:hypothetical protein
MDYAFLVPVVVTLLTTYSWVRYNAPKTATYVCYTVFIMVMIYMVVFCSAELGFYKGFRAAEAQLSDIEDITFSTTSKVSISKENYPSSKWPNPFLVGMLFIILPAIDMIAAGIKSERKPSKE